MARKISTSTDDTLLTMEMILDSLQGPFAERLVDRHEMHVLAFTAALPRARAGSTTSNEAAPGDTDHVRVTWVACQRRVAVGIPLMSGGVHTGGPSRSNSTGMPWPCITRDTLLIQVQFKALPKRAFHVTGVVPEFGASSAKLPQQADPGQAFHCALHASSNGDPSAGVIHAGGHLKTKVCIKACAKGVVVAALNCGGDQFGASAKVYQWAGRD